MKKLLWIVIVLSFIPAVILGVGRIQFENTHHTVAMVIDMPELQKQALENNLPFDNLLERYQQQGINGVAVYEDLVLDKIRRGEIIYQDGATLLALGSNAKPNWFYFRSANPNVMQEVNARYGVTPTEVTVAGVKWWGYPIDIRFFPAGPNLPEIRQLSQQGLVVVYRPAYNPIVLDAGKDIPPVPFVAYNGIKLPHVDDEEKFTRYTAQIKASGVAVSLIESTEQEGLNVLAKQVPAIRLFSIRPEWQATLSPEETASKFVLAARERSMGLLFLRPYSKISDTETLLTNIKQGLDKAGYQVGKPAPETYTPNAVLRFLSLLGPVAALILLTLAYPLRWLGILTGLGTLGLVIVAAGVSFAAGSLLAAVVFPALGLVLRRNHSTDWLLAIAISMMGVFFLSALGVERNGMLGIEPFKGVSLTLLLPLLLFAVSLVPNQDIRITLYNLYNTPLRLGDILLIGAGLVVVALVFLRRGNTPAVSVSDIESKVRQSLQDTLIRPRFKEIVGHPLAILGLSKQFPAYLSAMLLLGGVMGQSSLVNTFEHFHTPMSISLLRVLNGVLFGGVVGFVLLPAVVWVVRWFKAGVKKI